MSFLAKSPCEISEVSLRHGYAKLRIYAALPVNLFCSTVLRAEAKLASMVIACYCLNKLYTNAPLIPHYRFIMIHRMLEMAPLHLTETI